MPRLRLLWMALFALTLAIAVVTPGRGSAAVRDPGSIAGLHKLKHLIFIVQENRSFDHYFGTYPGADGIPTQAPCLPSQWYPSQCFTPYPNHQDSNQGGPLLIAYQTQDIDGGKMDGFVIGREQQLGQKCVPPHGRQGPRQIAATLIDDEGFTQNIHCIVDVMGYHDGTDLPNYWAYAQNYVLQDHFHEAMLSWSLVGHLGLFSGWSAICPQINPPVIDSCSTSPGGTGWSPSDSPPYLWTDITYLLWQHNVTWRVYLDGGLATKPQGENGTSWIWDVLPGFETVNQDGQVSNAEFDQTQFYSDAAAGTLPQVTWLLPKYDDAEHPQASVAQGQSYVTGLIDAVMSGPDWKNSAIFLTYDDIGGFYDHEPPPFNFDSLGLGIRVPAMIISPYAKAGYIDAQVCSTDCYLKFIEDVFLKSERMSQAGRPDPRPDYRDAESAYGDLANDFDFTKEPRAPLILSTHPMTMLRPDPEDAKRRMRSERIKR